MLINRRLATHVKYLRVEQMPAYPAWRNGWMHSPNLAWPLEFNQLQCYGTSFLPLIIDSLTFIEETAISRIHLGATVNNFCLYISFLLPLLFPFFCISPMPLLSPSALLTPLPPPFYCIFSCFHFFLIFKHIPTPSSQSGPW